jgi:hypothetical protein
VLRLRRRRERFVWDERWKAFGHQLYIYMYEASYISYMYVYMYMKNI